METPVFVGDVLEIETLMGSRLIGVVLEHEDNIGPKASDLRGGQTWIRVVDGPGVAVYWVTSETLALWTYERIEECLQEGTMKIIARGDSSRAVA